jgi:hypothetical protein
VGNKISRLLFDTSVLLYVDRFCPVDRPSKSDLEMLDQFVIYAFIWSYSLRAQYINLGWQSAQNYILGYSDKTNSFNLYKTISESESPIRLMSLLADTIVPINIPKVNQDIKELITNEVKSKKSDNTKTYEHYLSHFLEHNFWSIS